MWTSIHQRQYASQTDRQIDRRTDGHHAIAIPRFALKPKAFGELEELESGLWRSEKVEIPQELFLV